VQNADPLHFALSHFHDDFSGIFRTGVHGEPFRGGQQHIVFKLGIDKGLDVLATRTRKLKVQNADPLHFALSHFHDDLRQ